MYVYLEWMFDLIRIIGMQNEWNFIQLWRNLQLMCVSNASYSYALKNSNSIITNMFTSTVWTLISNFDISNIAEAFLFDITYTM